jgi:hypothetical protein
VANAVKDMMGACEGKTDGTWKPAGNEVSQHVEHLSARKTPKRRKTTHVP